MNILISIGPMNNPNLQTSDLQVNLVLSNVNKIKILYNLVFMVFHNMHINCIRAKFLHAVYFIITCVLLQREDVRLHKLDISTPTYKINVNWFKYDFEVVQKQSDVLVKSDVWMYLTFLDVSAKVCCEIVNCISLIRFHVNVCILFFKYVLV